MKLSRLVTHQIGAVTPLKVVKHRFSIAALAVVTALYCLGAATDANGQNAPRARGADNTLQNAVDATVVGSVAIIGTIAAVAIVLVVNHDHHLLKGCVSSGPQGPELKTGDSMIYLLEGDPSAIKIGEMVKVRGSKVKKTKESKGDQVFIVEQLKKDLGPCIADQAPARAATP